MKAAPVVFLVLSMSACSDWDGAAESQDFLPEVCSSKQAIGFTDSGGGSRLMLVNANLMRGAWGDGGYSTDDRKFMNYITSSSRNFMPDVLTFQEMKNGGTLSVHTCAEHANYMTSNMNALGFAAVNYNQTNTGTTAGGACVIFRKPRFGLVTSSNAGMASCNSYASRRARLSDSASGKNIEVASVHLEPTVESVNNCAGLALADIQNSMSGSDLKIIAGDFNITLGQDNWESYISAFNMVNAVDSSGESWTHQLPGGANHRIDYIWKNGGTVASSTVYKYRDVHATVDYSDHRALNTVFSTY